MHSAPPSRPGLPRISRIRRKSLHIDGVSLTALEAMTLLALDIAARSPKAVTDAARHWLRRYIANNAVYDEWRKVGWRKVALSGHFVGAVKALRKLDLLVQWEVTESGRIVAEALKPLLNPPMDLHEFTAYCKSTYSRESGRIE